MAKLVIIGAGLTGLSTAYHLEKNNFAFIRILKITRLFTLSAFGGSSFLSTHFPGLKPRAITRPEQTARRAGLQTNYY